MSEKEFMNRYRNLLILLPPGELPLGFLDIYHLMTTHRVFDLRVYGASLTPPKMDAT